VVVVVDSLAGSVGGVVVVVVLELDPGAIVPSAGAVVVDSLAGSVGGVVVVVVVDSLAGSVGGVVVVVVVDSSVFFAPPQAAKPNIRAPRLTNVPTCFK
jgi:hypothetical protein